MTTQPLALPVSPAPTGEVVVFRLSLEPSTCICCDQPADPSLPGDLELCAVCFNILAAPWPDDLPEPLF